MDTLTIQTNKKHNSCTIAVPSSKSYIHRCILAAALSQKLSQIDQVSFSEDIHATLDCVAALGADYEKGKDCIRIKSGMKPQKSAVLCCRESGSTLRFLIPIAMMLSEQTSFHGASSLFKRPLTPYFDIFQKNEVAYDFQEGQSLTVKGSLKNTEFSIDGGISSQFITGLLFALPLYEKNSVLYIQGELQSKPYVDITLDVLDRCGIEIQNNNYQSFEIRGSQCYQCGNQKSQGDYSQAAFFLAAGCLTGEIHLKNLLKDSLQGDKAIVTILQRMGADISSDGDTLSVKKSALHAIGEIDGSDIPDILPILSLCCSVAEGTTVIKNAQRLRMKECDRLFATVDILKTLGAEIRSEDSDIIINGKKKLNGGRVSSYNDHRMAMTAAVAALVCEEKVTIENPMSIRKSYPAFYDDFKRLGGIEYEWHMGQ